MSLGNEGDISVFLTKLIIQRIVQSNFPSFITSQPFPRPPKRLLIDTFHKLLICLSKEGEDEQRGRETGATRNRLSHDFIGDAFFTQGSREVLKLQNQF